MSNNCKLLIVSNFFTVIQKLRNRHAACLASTSLTAQEKERLVKILNIDFMSSEDSGSESGSGLEMATRRRVFVLRSLSWRSPEANRMMDSLDRKVTRRRTDCAKEMCRVRRSGMPSDRTPPSDVTDAMTWAVVDPE